MPTFQIDYEIPMKYYKNAPDGFTPIFAIGDVVLAENSNGKSYSYNAVINGKMKHIYHSKYRLVKAKHETVVAKMFVCGVISENQHKAEKKSEYDSLLDKLKAIFINILPRYGYAIREKQVELAEQMLKALYNRHISISEAGVGTGKTHAYILAALLVKQSNHNDFWVRSAYPLSRDFAIDTPMPIVISTSSIALQKAIVENYIPEISIILMDYRLIDKPLSCVVRKGKEHYICDTRLKGHIATIDKKIGAMLKPLIDKHFLSIDLDEMDSINPMTKKKICVNSKCNPSCGDYGKCRYMKFLDHAKSSKHDFQVCNHNYLIADILRRKQDSRPLLPNYQCVVVDESHKFLQAAQQMYGTIFSNNEMVYLKKYMENFSYKDKKTKLWIESYVDNALRSNKILFKLLVKSIPQSDDYSDDSERFKTEIGKQAKSAIKSVLYNLERVSELLSDADGIKTRNEHLYSFVTWTIKNVIGRLESFAKPDDIIYWLEISKLTYNDTKEIILSAMPKKLNNILSADLWSKPFPIILTSGTLSVAGNFHHIKKNMGLDLIGENRLLETSKLSPFDYKSNCLLYISKSVPFPDNKNQDYITAAADEVAQLIKATHGHTAVLFTSYKVMELVFEIVKNRNIDFPLIKFDRGGVNAIERFRKSKNGVLFASGSLWEGIDLPGDILSSLIIVKLPFAVPDPISEYEQSQYTSMEDYKRLVVFPEMILKLKQGFGRLIRKETDTGVVALLDYRVRPGGSYHRRVLAALPDCRITSDIAFVARFIKQKKKADYFS